MTIIYLFIIVVMISSKAGPASLTLTERNIIQCYSARLTHNDRIPLMEIVFLMRYEGPNPREGGGGGGGGMVSANEHLAMWLWSAFIYTM